MATFEVKLTGYGTNDCGDYEYMRLTGSSTRYCGTNGPNGQVVKKDDTIKWKSYCCNNVGEYDGFKICYTIPPCAH